MCTTRRLLLSGAALAGVGAVAGCGTLSQQQATQLQSLITGAQSIETSMASVVPALLPLIPMGNNDRANVAQALKNLTAATSALAGVPTIAAGASTVKAIEAALNTIVDVAASIPVIPEPYRTALVVAALALPPLEALADLAVQQGTALYATIQARTLAKAAIPAAG